MQEKEMGNNGDVVRVTHSRYIHLHPWVSVNSN